MKNLSISYTCIWSGVYIRCRVGSVGTRSRKCGGCGGFGFGLIGNHVRTEKLCLLTTMSRLGYMTICPTGKCSFVYNILWIKSMRLWVIYTVFYCTLWTRCVHCPLSLLQNIYTSTVKPVKLTTFIRWPPADVDHISVEPAKSYIACLYDHLRNFSTFICWIPVYVSHAKWNWGTVYTCLYWPWQYFRPVKCSKSLCLVSLVLYPGRSRWGTYHGCCSKRDGARTSGKTGSWAGLPTSSVLEFIRHKQRNTNTNDLYWVQFSRSWIPS
jgi:hypothetical protein